MSTLYTVKEGDFLNKIARDNGYKDWRELYYHPDNAEFRAKRPNPDLIYPGDQLWLPSHTPTEAPTLPQSPVEPPLVTGPDLWTQPPTAPTVPTGKGVPEELEPVCWELLNSSALPGEVTTVVLPSMVHLVFQTAPGVGDELLVNDVTHYELQVEWLSDGKVTNIQQSTRLYDPIDGIPIPVSMMDQIQKKQARVLVGIYDTTFEVIPSPIPEGKYEDVERQQSALLGYLGYMTGLYTLPAYRMFCEGFEYSEEHEIFGTRSSDWRNMRLKQNNPTFVDGYATFYQARLNFVADQGIPFGAAQQDSDKSYEDKQMYSDITLHNKIKSVSKLRTKGGSTP